MLLEAQLAALRWAVKAKAEAFMDSVRQAIAGAPDGRDGTGVDIVKRLKCRGQKSANRSVSSLTTCAELGVQLAKHSQTSGA